MSDVLKLQNIKFKMKLREVSLCELPSYLSFHYQPWRMTVPKLSKKSFFAIFVPSKIASRRHIIGIN